VTRYAIAGILLAVVSGCGSSTQSSSTVSRTRAQSWASAWCGVQPGGTLDDLTKAMGKPTTKYPDSGEPQQASWDAYEWQFNAFLGSNGNVHQMDINTIGLSESEKAALTCSETRIEP
jgi:hypothetical protein